MRINTISIPVQNQEKALQFYTQKLGFIKKEDVAMDQGHRWLTVASKENQSGPQILLEPSPQHFEPTKVYQKALKDAGIPYTQFEVDDLEEEYNKLVKKEVSFSVKPTNMGTTKIAVFDDTCGNNIQLMERL